MTMSTAKRLSRLLCCCTVLTLTLLSEARADAFANGNSEYAAGRFTEAAEQYQAAIAAGETSATVFYNLGNAWYRAGDLGRAILNYERALALEPRHPEATANVRLAREKARALELRKNWWEAFASRATTTHYAVTATIGFWVFAFAAAALLLRGRRSVMLMTACVAGVLACAIGVSGAYALETGTRGQSLAIVIDRKVDARLATADNANTVLTLPPGSEIKVLSTRGDWMYVALPNELRGWIPAQSAELVRL